MISKKIVLAARYHFLAVSSLEMLGLLAAKLLSALWLLTTEDLKNKEVGASLLCFYKYFFNLEKSFLILTLRQEWAEELLMAEVHRHKGGPSWPSCCLPQGSNLSRHLLPPQVGKRPQHPERDATRLLFSISILFLMGYVFIFQRTTAMETRIAIETTNYKFGHEMI